MVIYGFIVLVVTIKCTEKINDCVSNCQLLKRTLFSMEVELFMTLFRKKNIIQRGVTINSEWVRIWKEAVVLAVKPERVEDSTLDVKGRAPVDIGNSCIFFFCSVVLCGLQLTVITGASSWCCCARYSEARNEPVISKMNIPRTLRTRHLSEVLCYDVSARLRGVRIYRS